MWRRLLSRCHPDAGGDHDLFIWADALREHVAGDVLEDHRSYQRHRQPPQHPTAGERIPYEAAFDHGGFDDLTRHALRYVERVDGVYAWILELLVDCFSALQSDPSLYRQQHQGATYRQLAAIADAAGMSKEQRVGWYRVAESIPLSQRHAGHILSKLKKGAA